MRAVALPAYGGPEALTVAELPDPVAEAGQIHVRVAAAAVNPVDLSTRAGLAARAIPDPQFPLVLGWDVSGTVDQVGEGVTRFQVGDRVLGMSLWFATRRGTNAELVVLDEGAAAVTPAGLDDLLAATLPLNGLTAWSALFVARLEPGQRLLVTGAGGAVGSMIVRLASDRGTHVVGLGRAKDLEGIITNGGAEAVEDTGAVAPVDVAVDTTGTPAMALPAVRPGGRLLTVAGRVEGDTGDVTVKAVGVRNDAAALENLAGQAASGRLPIKVAEVFPFARAGDAHARMAAGGVRGRLVLTPSSS